MQASDPTNSLPIDSRQEPPHDFGLPDPFNDPPPLTNEDQLALLARALGWSRSFGVHIAVCDQPGIVIQLMSELRALLPNKHVLLLEVTKPNPNLYHMLRTQFSDQSTLPDILFAWGFERWIRFDEADLDAANISGDFVANLNVTRDLMPRLLRGPLVLWIPPHLLQKLISGAPDWFSTRSGVYFFSAAIGDAQSRSIASMSEILGIEGVAGLPLEEKRRRAEDLEKLLAELQAIPEEQRDVAQERRLLQAAAETYFTLADYEKTEPLLQRALRIDEASFGPDHHSVATDLNNLAQLLKATNRLSEAEPIMRRALQIDESFFGPDHHSVGTRLNNLASLLHATDRFDEAEPLIRRALSMDEVNYGMDHPNVSADLGNLAVLLMDTERLTEAEPLMRRALQIDEAVFGPGHPTVAKDLNNLAILAQFTNRIAEAEPLLRRALEISEAAFGPNHPNVGKALLNLALVEFQNGQKEKAESKLQRALTIFRNIYKDEKHPSIQAALLALETINQKE